jgi:hypothetical protein
VIALEQSLANHSKEKLLEIADLPAPAVSSVQLR